jgi:hypothetical protein
MIRFCDRRDKAADCNQISIRAAIPPPPPPPAATAAAVAAVTTELHNRLCPLLEFALRNLALTSRGTECRKDISTCPSRRWKVGGTGELSHALLQSAFDILTCYIYHTFREPTDTSLLGADVFWVFVGWLASSLPPFRE